MGKRRKAREMALVLQRVGLSEHAAIGVAKQRHFAQMKCLTHRLGVLDHVLDGVEPGILQLRGSTGATLVDEDQPVMAREGQQVGQKVIV